MNETTRTRSEAPERGAPGQSLSVAAKATGLFVRIVGVVLLLFGFWTGTRVVLEAWNLYDDPSRVDRFATAIEDGSHVDELLSPGASGTASEALAQHLGKDVQSTDAGDLQRFRFSYFIAWAVVLLLLMLIGRLTIWFIKTGGELALYDVQVRRVARALIREAGKKEKKIGR
jgi:hypothetical protein